MNPLPSHARELELDDFVRAFEDAREDGAVADLEGFLPARDHSLYTEILRELVRVDLEYGWECGQARPLEEYRQRFPELFRDRAGAGEMAYEEYRLRHLAGDNPFARRV